MTQIVQSYLSTLIRADFNIIQMRIFVIIVRRCRALVYGQRYSRLLAQQINTSQLNIDFSVPIKQLLGKSHNYKSLHVALAGMEDSWKIEWWDTASRVWRRSSWVNNVEIKYDKGLVIFSSPRWLINFMMDFSKGGFREYGFENAMSLSNPNAARLYLITCSMSKPYTYTIEQLKKTLGLQGKYKNFSQFENRILKPSERELERRSFNGFTYKIVRKGDSKFGSPVSVVLIPVKREKSLTDVQRIKDYLKDVPTLISTYLAQRFSFSFSELSRQKQTFINFSSLEGWEDKFIEICERTARKNKNHGYLINALKGEFLKQKSGEQ